MTSLYNNIRKNLYGCGFLLIVSILLLLTPCYFEVEAKKSIPKLENSISEVEQLLGDYTEYYVTAPKSDNYLSHDIGGAFVENDNIVLLLPSNVDMTNVVVDFYTMWNENIGSFLCDFSNGNTYTVKNREISAVQSDLQFVFIDVNEDDLNRVNSSHREGHEQKEKARIEVTSANNITIGGQIKPRGDATWHLYGKLPYNIKLDRKQDLFGLGVDKKWNLLANATDKTLLKNETFLDLGNALGLAYTPKSKKINLFVNGDYRGVYDITTKVSRGQNRVNIGSDDFLIALEAPNYDTKIEYDCHFWTNDDETIKPYIDVVWPDKESITASQKMRIQKCFQNFIDTIEQGNNADFSTVMDMESFAKYYWVQEIGMNADGLFRSTFMYYNQRDKKFYAGPLWDMEWTLGSTLVVNGVTFTEPTGWKLRNNSYYSYMFQNQAFVDEVNKVYADYHLDELMNNSYLEFLEKAKALYTEGNLNYRLWTEEQDFFGLPTNATNYEDSVNERASFYKARIDWISNEMRM